ncbi:hypothetical protein FRB99_006736 [Tulasnella sp. 403]|nr:hypothetical protein FRB99_006736 [Tulasnella sp. 403]
MHPNLQRMFSANAQWANDVLEHDPDFFAESAKGQSPKLLWIGCADSRVPESIIMAARPGDIFVHRNIANQFHLHDDSAQAVLSYAVNNLGVDNVAVVGHTFCGGAAACVKAASEPPSDAVSTSLSRWLDPMVEHARHLNVAALPPDVALSLLVQENVKTQVANVIRTDTIRNAWREGRNVVVYGWLYEIEKGQIRDLGIAAGPESLNSSN